MKKCLQMLLTCQAASLQAIYQTHVYPLIELLRIRFGEVQGSPGEPLHGCFGTYEG